ncbi:MAG TPA: NAD(P)/FAD-dependent oxidoreductase [Gammaproteobacteria bacterium]|nr:NAD(P)/FAD-dependent oxidoreductase [Gammaproteobacteria bacterium]
MGNVIVNEFHDAWSVAGRFSEYVETTTLPNVWHEHASTHVHKPGFILLSSGHLGIKFNGEYRYVEGPAFVAYKVIERMYPTEDVQQPVMQSWCIRRSHLATLSYDDEYSICPLNASIAASHRIQAPIPILHTKVGIFAVSGRKHVAGWEHLACVEKNNIFSRSTEPDAHLIWRAQRPNPISRSSKPIDLAIIGAGPAGLSLASWASDAELSYCLFGEPMSFWKRHIPPLPLRSPPAATNISTPRDGYKYTDFARRYGLADAPAIAMSDFIAYATDFCDRQAIRPSYGFIRSLVYRDDQWWLEYGNESVRAKNVAVALGLNGAQRHPGFPQSISYAWDYVGNVYDYSRLRGKRVAVLGGGQSGVEAVLLADDAGAEAHLVIRDEAVKYRSLHEPGEHVYRTLFRHSKHFMRCLPGFMQDRLLTYLLEGTAEPALEMRLERSNVTIHTKSRIIHDDLRDQPLLIEGPNGAHIPVDYVIVATGFKYDIRKSSLLSSLQIHERGGLPILNRHAMSSMPGLFFAGMSALRLVGPQSQFVFGSSILSPRIITGVKARVVK